MFIHCLLNDNILSYHKSICKKALKIALFTGHNQYNGQKRDRKNSQDKKEKSDAFSQISLKFSLRIFQDHKHSISWAIWTRNSNQYLSCVLLFNREKRINLHPLTSRSEIIFLSIFMCIYCCIMNTVILKHINYMLSTSEVYFHRQNTLNLTNTNLGRRGRNNNPFQRDSYLQNNNTILCIVIKYKASIQYWHVTMILIG